MKTTTIKIILGITITLFLFIYTTVQSQTWVFTNPVTEIKSTSANYSGKVNSSSLNPNLIRGFISSIVPVFDSTLIIGGANVQRVDLGSGTGTFTNIPSLIHNTHYWVRAFAINTLDTLYGEILPFKTHNWQYFNLDLKNDAFVSDSVFEFDIVLAHTGNYNDPPQFELSYFQCGIYFNSDFLNGGTATATVVPGTQNDLPVWQQQTDTNLSVVSPYVGGINTIRISAVPPITPNTGAGYGAIIKKITQGGSRIMRLRLTNTTIFNQIDPAMNISFSSIPNFWNTLVYSRVDSVSLMINSHGSFTNSMQIPNPQTNPVMTGGGTYCPSGAYVPVGINFSSPICGFQLQKDGFDFGPEIIGTGGPLTWYVSDPGYYTCLAGLFSISGSSVVLDALPDKPKGDTIQNFCQGAKINNIQILGNNIKWYNAKTGGNILYSLSNLVDGTTYWASQTNGSCESNDRLGVLIALTITPRPDALGMQAFCTSTTISNLVISGTDIRWYTAASGGTELPTNAIIASDTIIWASQTLNGCESYSRSPIQVSIGNVPWQPSGDSTQYFCTYATVGDLRTDFYGSTSIITRWYDANTGGNLLSPSQQLENGHTYYAKIVNGCESVNSLPVKVYYTANPVQTVTIQMVNNIQQTSATFNSGISSTCTGPATNNGYIYATHPHSSFSDPSTLKKTSGIGVGTFNTDVYGLLPNTYYWVKAYAILGNDTTYSQEISFNTNPWPFFNLEIRNAAATDNTHFEFDIYMVYRGSNSIPAQLELADIQLGVYFNSTILNKGTATATIVPGTQTDILIAQRQTNADLSVIGPEMGLKTIKINPKTVAVGSGTLFTSSQYNKRIMRVRLSNSVAFHDGYSFLGFSRTNADSSSPCIVRAYVGNIATNINANQTSYYYYSYSRYFGIYYPSLPPDGHGVAPIVIQNSTHSLKGGGAYCPNGTPVMIYMDSTNTGYVYYLYKNSSNVYNHSYGSGKSMAWFVTEPGLYVCGYGPGPYGGTLTYSPDTIVVTSSDPGMPLGSTPQSICPSASISNLAVSGSNIKWYDAPLWGNELSQNYALTGSTVYYASQNPVGCESKDRLGITYLNSRTLSVRANLEGLFDNNTNLLKEALDGNTGLPKWGVGIADKIDLELHQSNAPYTTINSQNNLVLSTSGIITAATPCGDSSDYYIAIKNRNHLETWSALPIPFNSQNIYYDFTTNGMQAYGTDAQRNVNPNVYAFYLGDLDQGGWVDAIDFNVFEPDLTVGSTGFYTSDFNGSGWVDSDDFNLFEPRLTMGVSSQWPGK